MTTKYVLHGGATSTDSPDNDKFYSYFTNLINKDEVNILMVLWARDKSSWDEKIEKHRERIASQTSKKFNLIIADDPEDLLRKIDGCDLLYLDGGYSDGIQPIYELRDSLQEKLKGKVCIGSSMGAFVICSYFVLSFDEQDTTTVYQGLDFLPINLLVHWDKEEEKEKKINLIKQKSDLPILTLNEGESVIFYS